MQIRWNTNADFINKMRSSTAIIDIILDRSRVTCDHSKTGRSGTGKHWQVTGLVTCSERTNRAKNNRSNPFPVKQSYINWWLSFVNNPKSHFQIFRQIRWRRRITKQSFLIDLKHTFRALLSCFRRAGLLSAFLLPKSKIAFCFPTFLLLFENSQLSFFIYFFPMPTFRKWISRKQSCFPKAGK